MFIQKIKNWFFSLFAKNKIGMTKFSNFLSLGFSGNTGIFCKDIINESGQLKYIHCMICYPTHNISIGFRVDGQTGILSISFKSFIYTTTNSERLINSLYVLITTMNILDFLNPSIQQFLTSNNYNWE